MSLFSDDLLSMDYSGGYDSPLMSFSEPSSFSDYQSYTPDYFGFDSYSDPYSDLFGGFDSYDPLLSTDYTPEPAGEYDFINGLYEYNQPDTAQIPYQDYADAQQTRDGGILSGIMDSAKSAFSGVGDFMGGKNNMSTLLALASLASMGQKPKGPVNAGGPVPSSVRATEVYNKFTPAQQANMEAFAAKKNLIPLAQQFDPRLYGYGSEIKFFDREA